MSKETLASALLHAFRNREWLDDVEPSFSPWSIAEAYEIQNLVMAKRIAGGEEVAGYKVGCTSTAIRQQFGLGEPICGRLFHPHLHDEGVELDWSRFTNCALEPEMVLHIGSDLSGEDLSDDELRAGIESVSAGMEVHNYTFWQGTPTLQELIASGGIHACLVVGNERVSPADLSFTDEEFSLAINGETVAAERARAIMGGPLHSLRWLVGFLTRRGENLRQGSMVIPGSPTPLIPLEIPEADVTVEVVGVGKVATRFRLGLD